MKNQGSPSSSRLLPQKIGKAAAKPVARTTRDPPTKAAAIGYREEDFAPRVLTSGAGEGAETLCSIARSHGIPIVESPELTEALTALKTFDYIPQKYWIIVAEILNLVRSNEE